MKRYMLLSIVLIMLLSSTVVFAQDQQKNTGKLTGKKIVMIIGQKFAETEFKESKDILSGREGADVIVASSKLSMATGGSLSVKPDILIDDINVKDYDAVVFIGGAGCVDYWDNPTAQTIAKEAFLQKKILAAICWAPVILAIAGVLKGKRATCYSLDRIISKGAIATDNDVERDGNIITANGPPASAKFGEKIVSALSEH